MKQVRVRIRGISPLLMHRFPLEPVEALEKRPPEEQARIALYEKDGIPYVPGVNIQRALIAGATFSKGKGRGTLEKAAAAGLFVDDHYVWVKPPTWVIDARPVVISSTRGRIIRYRPRFDEWELEFRISYDETLLSEVQVRRIVDDTGQRVGLLDFRPAKKGWFGRFVVTLWEPL
jgi:hypothetical protein